MKWTVLVSIPYEGITDIYCDNAEEVLAILQNCSVCGDDIEIFPTPEKTYDANEFVGAFNRGEID